MLYRPYQPNDIYRDFAGYAAWKVEAAEATNGLCLWYLTNASGSGTISRELYAQVKEYLKRYFFGKCAYCESDFAAVAFGDVEHYRPKLKVSEDSTHRGYYWLAYSEQNLLPSCERCNRGKGKRNHFPIAGRRATNPNENLDAELPLLLNPYCFSDCDYTAQHFAYDFEQVNGDLFFNGLVIGLTKRGDESIKIYDLNRPELVKRRAQSQKNGLNAFKLVWKDAMARQEWAREWLDGHQEHSSAVRAACLEWWSVARRDTDKLFSSG
jgi:hypothetical protein